MMRKIMPWQKYLKNILWFLVSVIIVSIITIQVMGSIDNNQIHKKKMERTEKFRAILENLEFNGLGEETISSIQEFTNMIDGYSNIIVTDDSGKVIYHINEGFMPSEDHFIAIVDANNRVANDMIILGANNEIKYKIMLDGKYNSLRLVEYSKSFDGSEDVFSRIDSFEDILRDQTYNVPVKNMNYAYIGSKGWNVYSIQEQLINNSRYRKGADFQSVFENIRLIAFMFFWLILPIWVFIDARKRNYKAPLWGILTLISNVIGFIIYILTRPEPTICKNCNEPLDEKYITCPYCGTANREVCTSCKKVIEKTWVSCPYCGQQVIHEAEEIAGCDELGLLPQQEE